MNASLHRKLARRKRRILRRLEHRPGEVERVGTGGWRPGPDGLRTHTGRGRVKERGSHHACFWSRPRLTTFGWPHARLSAHLRASAKGFEPELPGNVATVSSFRVVYWRSRV
jgi:hypothetical protein